MTDEQINIAIAEACGWLDIHRGSRKGIRVANGKFFWATKDAPSINYGREYSHVPSYLNDLNAMHEAEKVLLEQCGGDPQCELWIDYLANLLMAAPCCLREHATARQRAEAFLRTIGKWEEVKP